jgi:AcrR family transcriptional regulator
MEGIMATAFSENERERIRIKLNHAAQECLGKFGVKKTTVDQLVQITGISKGAFYIFYPSKEILFFTVLEEYQRDLMEEIFSKFDKTHHISAQEFSQLIYEIYQKVRHSFMMNIVQNQEFEYLMRKIPEEYIQKHHSFDDMLAIKLLSRLKVKKDIDAGIVTTSLRAIFMSMLHVKEIGEKDFDKVLKLLITGLAQQLIEEETLHE